MIYKPNGTPLNVLSILDKFSCECFKYECNLIQLNPDRPLECIVGKNIDVFIVESAWKGFNGKWSGHIADIDKSGSKMLKNMIEYCKSLKIPTVFWNKDDPICFNRFLEAAKLFDYIFTTDENSVEKYKKITGNNNVAVLNFSAQPKIHNPMNRNKEKIGKVAFAGTYNDNLEDRKKDISMLLNAALKYDLDIYDRMYYYKDKPQHLFPQIYNSYIKGFIPYDKMIYHYKKYNIFLNVNSVKDSPTMFSRRVLELLACGTNVVSNYSEAMENLFKDIVITCKNEDEVSESINMLINDSNLSDKISIAGQRQVFEKYTAEKALKKLLDNIGMKYKVEEKGVSIVSYIEDDEEIENVLKNYERQKFSNKELIIVTNNKDIDLKYWKENIKKRKNIRIFKQSKSKSKWSCINYGVGKGKFKYVSVFNPPDYYGENFITDIMNGFKYSDGEVIGKNTYYAYDKKENDLLIKLENNENKYSKFINIWSMIGKKEIVRKIKFNNEFIEKCRKKFIRIYSTDRFNYVYILKENQYGDEAQQATVASNCKDYIEYITA